MQHSIRPAGNANECMTLQYQRLIYFDVDGLVLKSMNHLFRLPSAPVAMPRAYWLPQPTMSDQLAVVEPSGNRLNELLHQAETFGEGLLHFDCHESDAPGAMQAS